MISLRTKKKQQMTTKNMKMGAAVLAAMGMTFTTAAFGADKAAERPTISLTAPESGDATALVQGAFDDAWRRGGATVVLEAGAYNVKGLRLRSHTTLHLRAGAMLKTSRDWRDYDILRNDRLEPVPAQEFTDAVWIPPSVNNPKDRKFNEYFRKSGSSWHDGAIRIYGATDVAIVGEIGSVIDGCNSYNPKGLEYFRGPHMVMAQYVTNLVLRGYTIVNAGDFAHYIKFSSNVDIQDVTVAAGHDGIHMDSSNNIRIQRCKIDTGDDCIAGFDIEDLHVSDCHLRTSSNLFRLGGRRLLIERCDCSGPGSYAWRSALTPEQRAAGASSYGMARRNPLSFFTYYCDYTLDVRQPAGEIVFRDCRVHDVDRLVHYNYSGNDFWQLNRPLESLTFENLDATHIGKSLCFYGDKDDPATLTVKDSRIEFKPVSKDELERMRKEVSAHLGHLPAVQKPTEFIRACNVRSVRLENVTVEGAEGPCVRSYGNVEGVSCEGVKGVRPVVEKATEPFVAHQI